jgi:uncharacterized Zn finger protein
MTEGIRCPSCRLVFVVRESDDAVDALYWTCPSCGSVTPKLVGGMRADSLVELVARRVVELLDARGK